MSAPLKRNAQWNSTICGLVEQAITLEKNYKEMLHQGDEVDERIQLWEKALEICQSNAECTSECKCLK
jgi:hypothetical protein